MLLAKFYPVQQIQQSFSDQEKKTDQDLEDAEEDTEENDDQ